MIFPQTYYTTIYFPKLRRWKGQKYQPDLPPERVLRVCWEKNDVLGLQKSMKHGRFPLPKSVDDTYSISCGSFCLASPLTTSSNLHLPAHPHPMGPACVWNFLTRQAGKQVWEKTEISSGVPVTSSCGGARGELTPRRGRTSGVVKPACASMQPVSERNSFGQQAQNWQQTKQNKIL